MKTLIPNSILIFLALGLAPISADMIKLKDGKEYQGRIIKENADSYEIEIQYSKNIKDLRTIKRDDLLSVTKEEENHNEELSAVLELIPTPDQLTQEDYAGLLKNKVEPLLALPLSKVELLQAKKIEKVLLAEKSRTTAGDLKIEGQWLSYHDRQANLYAIDAKAAFAALYLKSLGKVAVPTLIEFEKFEKEFSESQNFKMALEIALASINRYEPVILESLESFDARLAKRESNFLILSSRDLRRAKEEISKLEKKALANTEEAKTLKKKWFQSYAYEKTGLTALAQSLKSERTRLSQALKQINSKEVKAGELLYREAFQVIESGDLVGAAKHFAEVKSRKLPPKYTSILEAQLELKKKIIEEQKAEELAKLEAEKAKKEAEEKAAIEGEEATPKDGAKAADSPKTATPNKEQVLKAIVPGAVKSLEAIKEKAAINPAP